MRDWLYLLAAISAEVVATSSLKASAGFTKPLPVLGVVLGYAAAFYLLSLALRTIPVGIAYAIWSGLGIVLITAVAWLLFGQRLDRQAVVGIALIIVGIVILSVFSEAGAHG